MSEAGDVDALARGVLDGDRGALARAITLVESERVSDREGAAELLQRLLPHTGGALRVGISGVPGAGKSTLIDALGVDLVGRGHRLAVLAVDPSSRRTGGSVLGDKTRMARLSREEGAFIRPSPAGASLGGVAKKTREAMLVCEAAGYDLVFVETVGVGQSEVSVSDMVDLVVLLLLAGAGDELQGIKRGVLEVADAVVIQKAEGEALTRAQRAKKDLRVALSLLRGGELAGAPPVTLTSALEGTGLEELWSWVERESAARRADGRFEARRQAQAKSFFHALVDEGVRATFRGTPAVAARLPELERAVADGALDPTAAADELVALFRA